LVPRRAERPPLSAAGICWDARAESTLRDVSAIRLVLLLAITVALVGIVVALASGATGVWEKAVVVFVGLALLVLAARVRRLGTSKPSQT
jgi:peptidoglycan/LPS O-acetylase OafA/YrhL